MKERSRRGARGLPISIFTVLVALVIVIAALSGFSGCGRKGPPRAPVPDGAMKGPGPGGAISATTGASDPAGAGRPAAEKEYL